MKTEIVEETLGNMEAREIQVFANSKIIPFGLVGR